MIDEHDNKTADLLDDSNIVYYEGKPVLRLNQRLITQKGLDKEEVDKIKELHVERIRIEDQMSATDDPSEIKRLFNAWTTGQYLLQSLWGFPEDINYHPSHRLSKCTCGATMDNDERLGTPYKVVSHDCPIHGENI